MAAAASGGPLPPLRRLEAFERSTRDRPLYQLPVGSVDLSAPPSGLEVDTADLARLRQHDAYYDIIASAAELAYYRQHLLTR